MQELQSIRDNVYPWNTIYFLYFGLKGSGRPKTMGSKYLLKKFLKVKISSIIIFKDDVEE